MAYFLTESNAAPISATVLGEFDTFEAALAAVPGTIIEYERDDFDPNYWAIAASLNRHHLGVYGIEKKG